MIVTSWCKQNGIVEQTYYEKFKKLREEFLDNLLVLIEPEPQNQKVFKKLEVQVPLPNKQAAVIIRLPNETFEITEGTSQQ